MEQVECIQTLGNVPDGYKEGTNDKTPLGRPAKKVTKRNTQDDNFGKDRLGASRYEKRL